MIISILRFTLMNLNNDNSGVVPVSDYSWGFTKNSINEVQNRACRFYFELHAKAPIFGFEGEISWMLPKYKHFLLFF